MSFASEPAPTAEPQTTTRDMNPIRRRRYGASDAYPCTAIHCPEPEDEYDSEDEQSTDEAQACICAECLGCLLATRSLAGDLAGHMFGHLVSTELARDILTTFVMDGIVQVFETRALRDEYGNVCGVPIETHSQDQVRHVVQRAFEAAIAHDCIRLSPEGGVPKEHEPSAEEETVDNKKYAFKWRTFPEDSLGGNELVSFLNDITDRGFAVAKSQSTGTGLELKHRFATPKRHYVPLGRVLDKEPIRPDFFLLPIQAFSGDGFKTVDEKYINFTALRLVGGVSKEHPRMSLEQTKLSARGLKSAQPWVYYVLGLSISLDVAVFSRGDSSEWEHLALVLWDGRGCIEFIRILLGLALADAVLLGQNPFIELSSEIHTFELNIFSPLSDSSSVASLSADCSHDDSNSSDSDDMSVTSCHTAPASPRPEPVEKRPHSEIEEDGEEYLQLKKCKIVETESTFSPDTDHVQ